MKPQHTEELMAFAGVVLVRENASLTFKPSLRLSNNLTTEDLAQLHTLVSMVQEDLLKEFKHRLQEGSAAPNN